MTFLFLPRIPSWCIFAFPVRLASLAAVAFFMFMTITTLHFLLTFDDRCDSHKFGLFFYCIADFICIVLHIVSMLCTLIVIPGILITIPLFVTIFMFAYCWWVFMLFVTNTIRVWACMCGGAKFWGLILHILGYFLPCVYFFGLSVINTFAERIDA